MPWPNLANVIPNMLTQVGAYVSTAPPAGPQDLFVVWGGPNDLFNGQTDPRVPVANLVAALEALADHGEREFLVANLPPLELTPYGRGLPPAQQAGLRQLVLAFNALLAQAAGEWAAGRGIDLTFLDVYRYVAAGASDPGRFGLTNVTDPALGVLLTNPGADVSGYLFWDNVHPTTRGQSLLAAAALQQLAQQSTVPEPSSLVLLLVGVAAGVGARRKAVRRLAARVLARAGS